eukprot:m51a1_g708 hypothetical protein (262) ;mRNA; f:403176-404527
MDLDSGTAVTAVVLAEWAAYEAARRSVLLSIGVCVVLPIILTRRCRANAPKTTWFVWAKTYTALSAACWFLLVRQTPSLQSWAPMGSVCLALLVVNMLEAIARDFEKGHPGNAVAGILLVLSIRKPMSIQIDPSDPYQSLLWDGSWMWILGYAVWNCVFTINYSLPHSHLTGFAANAATLVAAFLKRERWIESRAYTLSFLMLSLLALKTGAGGTSQPNMHGWPSYVRFCKSSIPTATSLTLAVLSAVEALAYDYDYRLPW